MAEWSSRVNGGAVETPKRDDVGFVKEHLGKALSKQLPGGVEIVDNIPFTAGSDGILRSDSGNHSFGIKPKSGTDFTTVWKAADKVLRDCECSLSLQDKIVTVTGEPAKLATAMEKQQLSR